HCITDGNNNPKCTFTTCVCFTQPTKPGLCGLLHFGQLVPVTSTPHSASRSGLSTPSSLGNLKRNLISKQASRLDAFSGYPSHTYPTSHATGVTTGAPEVCPTRSSRTRVSLSQVSTRAADRDRT